MSRLYENVFIVRQDLTAAQVDALSSHFAKTLTDLGGTVAKVEYCGLRTLAYKINKNRKGHYVLMHVDAPSDAVKEMERMMRINEDILRYLTLSIDEIETGPSVLMTSRSSHSSGYRSNEGDAETASEKSEEPVVTETASEGAI